VCRKLDFRTARCQATGIRFQVFGSVGDVYHFDDPKGAIEGLEEVRMRYDAVFIDVDGKLLWVDLGLKGCTKSET
jgi:hypothetical protein